MKLTAILLTLFFLQVRADGYTQGSITYSGKDVPLEKVIDEIKKQSGYSFFYNESIWKSTKPVTLNVKNASLLQVLQIAFKDQPISFVIEDKTVILSKKKVVKEEKFIMDNKPVLLSIQGKVVNGKGEPIAKASVSVKETNVVTITNTNGEFYLSNINEDAVLLITNVGFEAESVPVNGRKYLQIILGVKVASLEDVVVIGYGQVTKRYNTGNVSTVKATDIEKQPVSNPLLTLAGRVPGLEVFQATGISGSAVNIKIRGLNSVLSGNDPLYVIDGVPYSSQNMPGLSLIFGNSNQNPGSPFSYINPADIESISILKDADATAIYGSRGANGVILITTKKGRAGETKVSVNAQTGFGKVSKKMDLLNTRQYLDMRYEAFKNDGAVPNPNADFDLMLWDTTRYTDWQKELIGGTSRYNDIQATISGGNANTQVLVGTGYHKETTVFPGNLGNQRGSVHFNLQNISPNKKFKVSLSGMYTLDNNRLSAYDFTEAALTLPPDAPPMYNPDGSINWAPNPAGASSWPLGNPAALLLVGYKTHVNNLVGQANISYEIIPGLEVKSNFGYTNNQSNDQIIIPQSSQDPFTWATLPRRAQYTDNKSYSWIIEPQINYSTKVFKGQLTTLVGATVQKNFGNGQSLFASGFSSDNVMEDIRSATSVVVLGSTNFVYRYSAVFGRLNYNWQDKYFLNVTARKDGSSRFGPVHRFSGFGAIGAGWIFTSERFIKIPFLSFGKLRGSYGTTGNDQIGDYSYMDLYNPISVGAPYFGTAGISPSRIYTPDLSWEETKKLEAALELGFLNDRIYLSISSYQNHSNSQLLDFPLSAVTGFTSIRRNLDALVQNRGLEIEVRTQNVSSKHFRWTSSFNVSRNWNKLVNAPSETTSDILMKVGYSLTSSFVYPYIGVDPIKGLYQFSDVHGNATMNPNATTDRTYHLDFGNEFYGGLQNSLSYKNFQVDILLQFVQGRIGKEYLYNYIPGFYGINQPTYVLNRWQKPGDVSQVQQFSQNYRTVTDFTNADLSSQSYGDASFVRLKNVSVSWQWPDAFRKKLHLTNGRLYAQGQNLYTITKYRGFDPETRSRNNLPALRVITFGLQVTL